MFEKDNQRCLVYKFESDLCDAGYVGYTPLTPAN